MAVVEEVREHLDDSGAAILTEYRGLKVGDLAALRRQLRSAGAEYKIYKNTLVRRATADTDRAVIDSLLVGPTAIVFVDDDIASVAKVLREFGRAHPQLVVKGGLIGSQLLDAGGASALADLPSREAQLAQLAGAIAAPMQQFAGLLQALPRNLAFGLSALLKKRSDEEGPPPAAAEAEAEPRRRGRAGARAGAAEPEPERAGRRPSRSRRPPRPSRSQSRRRPRPRPSPSPPPRPSPEPAPAEPEPEEPPAVEASAPTEPEGDGA